MTDIVERLREWRRGVGWAWVTPTDAVMEEAADEIERLRDLKRTLTKTWYETEKKFEHAEAVIAAARKVIRTHPMSQSRDEQIRKLLEVIVAYDKGDEPQATTQCGAEAVIEAARAWCRATVAAGWSDWSMVISFVRDDFAPHELALFDAIIAYDKERDDG